MAATAPILLAGTVGCWQTGCASGVCIVAVVSPAVQNDAAATAAVGRTVLEINLWFPLPQRLPGAAAAPSCVRCRAPMIYRDNALGKFWGCSRFPGCQIRIPATHNA